jgi:radical SAM superfamily enzyme YgiQ (UPF0313 family)
MKNTNHSYLVAIERRDFMKRTVDLMFLHPPAILNGHKPILDADVAYSHQFVSMPVGLFGMANNLEKSGFEVGILNLGESMLRKREEELINIIAHYIADYKPKIIGIDLHWWVHSAGAVETARLVKEIDSSIVTLLGGITSSFYAEEILSGFTCVDYVLTGECDETIVSFAKCIIHNEVGLYDISGLVYRDAEAIIRNAMSPPLNLDNLDITRYNDFLIEPIVENPDRAIIPITRGCAHSCTYCGASSKSFAKTMGRSKVCFLKPETIVDLIVKSSREGRNKIYIYGDVQGGGKSYANTFFTLLSKADIEGVRLVVEFFSPPNEDIVEKWLEITESKNIVLEATISPDSGNDSVRKKLGRNYTNEKLLISLRYLYKKNIPVSVYFLLGCPGESDDTVSETLRLSNDIIFLYSKYFTRERVRHSIIGYEFMQIPDLGSEIHKNPEKHGITIDVDSFRGLVERIKNATHWSQLIGFATEHFSRDELVKQYYRIKYSIQKMYFKHGLVDEDKYCEEINHLNNDRLAYMKLTKDDIIREKGCLNAIFIYREPSLWRELYFECGRGDTQDTCGQRALCQLH